VLDANLAPFVNGGLRPGSPTKRIPGVKEDAEE
jgi:hypothetical protein